MATSPCIATILLHLTCTSNTLFDYHYHTRPFTLLSPLLFDLNESLTAASKTLESWQRKYDIQDRRPVIYNHVLFGKIGWERIGETLTSVEHVAQTVGEGVDRVVGCALRARPKHRSAIILPPPTHRSTYDAAIVTASVQRILNRESWSRRFETGALKRCAELQVQIERLHRKLGTLERLSDLYLELEHQDLFTCVGTRLLGRRSFVGEGDPRLDVSQNRLLDAVSARKDAELLHRASVASSHVKSDERGEDEEEGVVHIGLCVPQIHRRDFAFLLESYGEAHEILTHPVRIKSASDSSILKPTMAAALPDLLRRQMDIEAGLGQGEATYLLPSSTTSSGFQVSFPPSSILVPLSLKEPVAATIYAHAGNYTELCLQTLRPQDQVALVCGIAQGCLRLMGTQWLESLDSTNVRWRKGREGCWTAMLASTPGDEAITGTVKKWIEANPGRNAKKRAQVFRLGLLLADLTLQTPITKFFVSAHNVVEIYIDGLGEGETTAVDAVEIAAEVESKTNLLVGNIVFFCLHVLDEDDIVDRGYERDVLGQVEELERLVRSRGRRGGSTTSSVVETPRSGKSRSNRSSVLY